MTDTFDIFVSVYRLVHFTWLWLLWFNQRYSWLCQYGKSLVCFIATKAGFPLGVVFLLSSELLCGMNYLWKNYELFEKLFNLNNRKVAYMTFYDKQSCLNLFPPRLAKTVPFVILLCLCQTILLVRGEPLGRV